MGRRDVQAPGHVLPEYNTSVPHNNELKGFILWHPNEREKAKACLDKRFANRLKVIALSKYGSLPAPLSRCERLWNSEDRPHASWWGWGGLTAR